MDLIKLVEIPEDKPYLNSIFFYHTKSKDGYFHAHVAIGRGSSWDTATKEKIREICKKRGGTTYDGVPCFPTIEECIDAWQEAFVISPDILFNALKHFEEHPEVQ